MNTFMTAGSCPIMEEIVARAVAREGGRDVIFLK